MNALHLSEQLSGEPGVSSIQFLENYLSFYFLCFHFLPSIARMFLFFFKIFIITFHFKKKTSGFRSQLFLECNWIDVSKIICAFI